MEYQKKHQTQILQGIGNTTLVAPDAEQSETGKTSQQHFNFHYYEEYKKLYVTGYYLAVQMKQLLYNKEQLWVKSTKLQKKTEDFKDNMRGQPLQKKKRYRRTAEQMERNFICQVQICQKNYGSEGSLHQHIKLKHPELYRNKYCGDSISGSF